MSFPVLFSVLEQLKFESRIEFSLSALPKYLIDEKALIKISLDYFLKSSLSRKIIGEDKAGQ